MFSIIAGIGFGVALFLRKLSVKELGLFAFIVEAVVEALIAVLFVYFLFPFNLTTILSKQQGLLFGIAGGISIGIGVIAFFLAAKYGSALTPSIVGPVLSALTASFLAILILHEILTPMKLFGAALALIGLVIFLRF